MLDISPIHAFSDNFIWLLRRPGGDQAVVVDPGDARPVIQTLQTQGLRLTAILITHEHADHVGGIAQLLRRWPGVPVFGPARESIPHITRTLGEGDEIRLPGLDASCAVLDVPGHTAGHIAYYGDWNQGRQKVLFCGDTLFSCGCGRIFSGTFEQMHHSLGRIAALPGDTLIYCAHEYTLDNIGFAQWVEPDNPALEQRKQACFDILDQGGDTVPNTLENERATNPFLRLAHPNVLAALMKKGLKTAEANAEAFALLRTWKDREYD